MSFTSTIYETSYLEQADVAATDVRFLTSQEASDYARVDSGDALLDTLISAAHRAFEQYTASLLVQRQVTATYTVERDGKAKLELPYKPVVDITSVQDEDAEDLDYTLTGNWIELDNEFSGDTITVIYTAGRYEEADDIDGQIKLGMLKYISSSYDDRDDTVMGSVTEMPNSSKKLWEPYRYRVL